MFDVIDWSYEHGEPTQGVSDFQIQCLDMHRSLFNDRTYPNMTNRLPILHRTDTDSRMHGIIVFIAGR
jgi:hypothetical protein